MRAPLWRRIALAAAAASLASALGRLSVDAAPTSQPRLPARPETLPGEVVAGLEGKGKVLRREAGARVARVPVPPNLRADGAPRPCCA
jgi:hypothetical protein